MKFPNAHNGVKKIYFAELLSLFASIVLIISAIVMVAGMSAIDAGAQSTGLEAVTVVAMILAFLSFAAMMVAFVFNLIGIIKASADEDQFQSALIFTIIGMVVSMIPAFFPNQPIVSSAMNTLTPIVQMLITIFVVQGIINLSLKLGNSEMAERGNRVLWMTLLAFLLSAIASLIATLFQASETMEIAAAVVAIIGIILSIVAYFIYLGYLKKAVKMLGEAKAEAQAE